MGLSISQPYNRTVHWYDPRDADVNDGYSHIVYKEWKTKRMKKAQSVKFDQTCMGHVYDMMEQYAGRSMALDKSAFGACLTRIGVPDELHDALFGKFDADGDGAVDPGEFCDALDKFINGGHHFMLLQSCFRLFDQNHSGRITNEEIEACSHQLQMKKTALFPNRAQIQVMAKVMRSPHKNNDNRMLTFNDFVTVCTKQNTTLAPFMPHIIAVMCTEILPRAAAPSTPTQGQPPNGVSEDEAARQNKAFLASSFVKNGAIDPGEAATDLPGTVEGAGPASPVAQPPAEPQPPA